MCCFGVRVFLLIFITILSFVFHRLWPNLPVVGYYFLLSNLLAFMIFTLFFRGALPAFVKPAAVHYFSLIGGIIGALFSMAIFRKFARDAFSAIEFALLFFWLTLGALLVLNFATISAFFQELLL